MTESVLGYTRDANRVAASHIGVPAEVTGRLDTVSWSGGDKFAVSSYWLDDRRFGGLADRWIPSTSLASVLREAFEITLY